jgi:G3E family GTPase
MPSRATVTLVTGASPRVREQAIFAALAAGPEEGAKVAVILEGLADASAPLAPGAHLSVSRIAGGCLCCAGNLVLRVTLNRLLRLHPDRVFIGVGSSDHLDQLRSWLESPPYDQLLALAPDLQA